MAATTRGHGEPIRRNAGCASQCIAAHALSLPTYARNPSITLNSFALS